MRTLFLTKRWQHHSPAGGYDQLAAAFPGATVVRRVAVSSRAAKIGDLMWHKWSRAWENLVDYQYGDYLAENRVLWECARGGVDVVHALYGDEQLDLLLRWRRRLRARLVATFHLPTASVTQRWEYRQAHLLGGLDAAVVVARTQLADYRRWLGEGRVVFIPHGVHTERFRPAEPAPPPGERLRLLVVGEHMRDWDAMHRVADRCAAANLPVEFDAVLPRSCAHFFTGCENVRIHHGVPEDALIELYQRADALFLPVTGATANNAVLEALACGTPVITTAVGGMPDYVDEASGWLFPPGECAALVDLIAALCRDRAAALAKRAGARAKALTFGWESVVAQTRAVHEAVVQGLPLPEPWA